MEREKIFHERPRSRFDKDLGEIFLAVYKEIKASWINQALLLEVLLEQ
jgi:hypothetical protein